MGLGSFNNGGKRKYLTLVAGKITMRVKADYEGAQKRILKNGKEVWEMQNEYLEGKITGMEAEVHQEFGVFMNVLFQDNEQMYQLQIPVKSGYFYGFASRLRNIDFSKPVRFAPYLIDRSEEGKSAKAVSVCYQQKGSADWDKVPSAFTRENPNGLPELEKHEIDGKTIWSDKKRNDFFFGIIKNEIKPKIAEVNSDPIEVASQGAADYMESQAETQKQQEENAAAGKTDYSEAEEELDDGLPF